MMAMKRRCSAKMFAGFVVETFLFFGCASVTASEAPLSTPVATTPSQRVAQREGATGDDLTQGAVDTSRTDGGPAAVDPTAAPTPPPLFAERRGSEAMDRLAAVVTIRREKRGAVIALPTDRLVDAGQWSLTSSGRYSVRELADGLRDRAERTILIQGYTDSLGAPASNEALSLRRAEAVRDFLITLGVAAESMHAEGWGAKRPVASNATSEGRAQNRRIEIVIAP